MIVVDASALADILLEAPVANRLAPVLQHHVGAAHAPDILDVEVTSVARRSELRGVLSAARARAMFDDLAAAPIERHPIDALLGRAWELRHNFTVPDALYVALAEAIDGALLTSDARLVAAVRAHTDIALVA